jgi:superoxide dismutase, Cu-Zn family
MKTRAFLISATIAAAALFAGGAAAQETATANMQNQEGEDVGTIELRQLPGGVLLDVNLQGLPPGVLGFHIHETGACEGDFMSAGGHYNPEGHDHGFHVEGGPHAGDMPNLHVPETGVVRLEVWNAMVTLAEGEPNSLFKEGGTAIVVHAQADDYQSQPAGDAGPRFACGVIE